MLSKRCGFNVPLDVGVCEYCGSEYAIFVHFDVHEEGSDKKIDDEYWGQMTEKMFCPSCGKDRDGKRWEPACADEFYCLRCKAHVHEKCIYAKCDTAHKKKV